MTLRICDGDLLDQDVEAIVNSWNRNIIPWWPLLPQGVSGATKRRAGYEPFHELARHGPDRHEVLLAHSLMDGAELRIVAMMAGDGVAQREERNAARRRPPRHRKIAPSQATRRWGNIAPCFVCKRPVAA